MDKAVKKAASEAKKQAKIDKDEKKRAEKKALAEANANLHELRKIKVAEKKEEGDNYANEYAPHELADMLNWWKGQCPFLILFQYFNTLACKSGPALVIRRPAKI